ncbi:uncharacterized protein LOC112575050 isoform X1 [Pomacea canaliculata]|uniref:uncharacterized protein LOC112575050 isoform X1 n=2 Tax=Pomacea canaliculata TaxID=400727 RepID=UPI000D734D29|nr:uncharacterized protein LOC112575050 isoform X1 [Pomacea canaliculata]
MYKVFLRKIQALNDWWFLQHMSCRCHQLSSATMKTILIMVFLHIAAALPQEGSITCSVPPVEIDQDAVLNCSFPEDLNTTKRDFAVYHYPDDKGDAVVDCWWLKGAMTCSARPEIRYEMTVGHTFTITLQNISSSQTGRYACQIANYNQNLIQSCELTILSGLGNTCSVTEERSEPSATLTCYFKEDISKTQVNFTVYRHSGAHKQNVAGCWWEKGQRQCQVANGYQLTSNQSQVIKIMILEVTKETAGNYSCWHPASPSVQTETCIIHVREKVGPQDLDVLMIGLIVGLVVTAILILVAIVILLIYRRRRELKTKDKAENEESQLMVEQDKKVNEEFLVKSVREMFPNMLDDACYFVPPIYFNKVRYKTQTVADQVVYIPEPSDPTDAEHDKAMRQFLNCFYYIPKTKKEQMFVLTQFNYEDYLNNPGDDFSEHCLPVPEQKEDKNIGCFDILIIHRYYGLMVGVLKTVSEYDSKTNGDELQIDRLIANDVSAAIPQLNKASGILHHLMKDLNGTPPVRRFLILPNITLSTLKRALHSHNEVFQNLRKCFATEDSPVRQCLCADHLSDPKTPTNVDDRCVSKLTDWWDTLNHTTADISAMTDAIYESLIARFCGPATTSCLDKPRRPESFILPKSLDEAVSLTGDLFERLTLYPDMTDLLTKPRVFLAGPPGTEKTRILALVGRMWLNEGHVVHIINTSTEQSAASVHLKRLLQEKTAAQGSASSSENKVIILNCNIQDEGNISNMRNIMRKNSDKKYVWALADDLDPDETKLMQIRQFFRKLHREFQDLHLWAASYSMDFTPMGRDVHIFRAPLSCPPTVLRKVLQEEDTFGEMQYSESQYLSLTDGVPVKDFAHKRVEMKGKHICDSCGEEIVKFLKESLRISGVVTPGGQPSRLQSRDLLVLFEDEVTESTPLVRTLVQSGIPVEVVSNENLEDTLKNENNVALAAKAGFLCGIKRKVVVYVEGEERRLDTCVRWNRLRGITSCTSQLIILSSKTPHRVGPVV